MEGVQDVLTSSAKADGGNFYCFEVISASGKVLNTASTNYTVDGDNVTNVKLIVSANLYLKAGEEVYLVYRPSDTQKSATGTVTLTSVTAINGEHGCKGGTSDCMHKAKCEICGKEYGDFNYDKHVSGCKVTYTKDQNGHIAKWSKCGMKDEKAVAHTWSNGKCEKCSFKCTHPSNSSEANCAYAAICAVCGNEHGAKNPDIHLKKEFDINFRAATATKHFICYDCCMDEYIAEDHTFVNGVCIVCEYGSDTHTGGNTGTTTNPDHNTTPDETPKPDETTKPDTTTGEIDKDSDSGNSSDIILIVALIGAAVIFAVIVIALVFKRRK
jgi:hypothetical protein